MPPSVDIVIVNWNAGDQLRACLASIAVADDAAAFEIGRVVVVDNNSTDDSLTGIDNYSLPVVTIVNVANRGFGAACNQGAAGSAADFLLFLNPDAVLNLDSIRLPIAFMEDPDRAQVGVVGIRLVDETGAASRTCSRFPNLRMLLAKLSGLDRLAPRLCPSYVMEEWDHTTSAGVDHVIGAFYLVRRPLFERLRGFDERFFVYLEDLDFSLRAHQAGAYSYFLAEACAFHKGGGVSEQVKAKRLYYSLQSRILYSCKHLNPASAILVTLGTLLVEPWVRLLYLALHGPFGALVETVQAYLLLWRAAGKLFRA